MEVKIISGETLSKKDLRPLEDKLDEENEKFKSFLNQKFDVMKTGMDEMKTEIIDEIKLFAKLIDDKLLTEDE